MMLTTRPGPKNIFVCGRIQRRQDPSCWRLQLFCLRSKPLEIKAWQHRKDEKNWIVLPSSKTFKRPWSKFYFGFNKRMDPKIFKGCIRWWWASYILWDLVIQGPLSCRLVNDKQGHFWREHKKGSEPRRDEAFWSRDETRPKAGQSIRYKTKK